MASFVSPIHFIFFLLIYIIAFLTAFFIRKQMKDAVVSSRFDSIDGLRGVLALGVFIHHSVIWYFLLTRGRWQVYDSNMYNQFGATSVLLFFMITGFLFSNKLITDRHRKWNWTHFYTRRFFRLFPAYLVSVLLVIITVFLLTGGKIQQNSGKLTGEIINWLLFSIKSIPDINRVKHTFFINAGVTWSLAYEWLFYFSLPILSLLILKFRNSSIIYVISFILIVLFFYIRGFKSEDYFCYGFISGCIPAILIRFDKVQILFKKKYSSFISDISIVLSLYFITLHKSINVYTLFLSTLIFTLIVLNGSLFGLLKLKTVRFLGDLSYSIYLFHGIILFFTFRYIMGIDFSRSLSSFQYSLVIFALTPVVVATSYFVYRNIEKPVLDWSRRFTDKR